MNIAANIAAASIATVTRINRTPLSCRNNVYPKPRARNFYSTSPPQTPKQPRYIAQFPPGH